KASKPYTLYDDFPYFMNNYLEYFLPDQGNDDILQAMLDSVECEYPLRDIFFAHMFYEMIDGVRQPLDSLVLDHVEKHLVKMPQALAVLKNLNDKYVAIQKRSLSDTANLKSADEVADMSDGEKILRKITEPYRGKLILLDIWGTWCGPCKEALSHSQEEYERLKDFDLIYLYLANNSDDESWKNVIKEYNLVGDNVVHYNLPESQQSAIENFLQVHSFPTYKLIDRDGFVLDVNADPRNLEGLARLLEQIKSEK
ncbi:MAG: TlpA family protein disulfide reductase, partial [Bacteroidaceae bacterium]|nr:TlpA family protein disulfide reductase [Bacteroidaceae bacterium]